MKMGRCILPRVEHLSNDGYCMNHHHHESITIIIYGILEVTHLVLPQPIGLCGPHHQTGVYNIQDIWVKHYSLPSWVRMFESPSRVLESRSIHSTTSYCSSRSFFRVPKSIRAVYGHQKKKNSFFVTRHSFRCYMYSSSVKSPHPLGPTQILKFLHTPQRLR